MARFFWSLWRQVANIKSLIPILNQRAITTIFCNIEEVIELSQQLFNQLSERIEQNKVEITFEVLIKTMGMKMLRVYQTYMSNYLNALTELRENKITNSAFREWLKKTQKDPKLNYKKLEDFLIMPVQRVPRYLLLAKEIQKETGTANDDAAGLEKMVAALTIVIEKINKAQQEAQKNFVKKNKRTVQIKEAALMTVKGNKNPRNFVKYIITVFKGDRIHCIIGRTFEQFIDLCDTVRLEKKDAKMPKFPQRRKVLKNSTNFSVVIKRAVKLTKFLNQLLASNDFGRLPILQEFLHPVLAYNKFGTKYTVFDDSVQ